MPYVIGEVEVVNEVTLVPTASLYDGAIVADGDLTVTVTEFFYRFNCTYGKYSGSTANAVTNNATSYVYLDATGTLNINTTGYPTTTGYIKLGRVVAAGGFITRIIFERAFISSSGSKYGVKTTLTHGGVEATLITIPISDNTKSTLRASIEGQAGTATCTVTIVGVFLRQGGGVIQKVNTTAIPNYLDDALWNPRLVVSGNNVLVKATPDSTTDTIFTARVWEELVTLV